MQSVKSVDYMSAPRWHETSLKLPGIDGVSLRSNQEATLLLGSLNKMANLLRP